MRLLWWTDTQYRHLHGSSACVQGVVAYAAYGNLVCGSVPTIEAGTAVFARNRDTDPRTHKNFSQSHKYDDFGISIAARRSHTWETAVRTETWPTSGIP